MLAQNEEGYRNLIKLTTVSHLEVLLQTQDRLRLVKNITTG